MKLNKAPTKKEIYDEILKKTGEVAELWKDDGLYYWGGEASIWFQECFTGYTRLSDVSLDKWVNDYETRLKESGYLERNADDEISLDDDSPVKPIKLGFGL